MASPPSLLCPEIYTFSRLIQVPSALILFPILLNPSSNLILILTIFDILLRDRLNDSYLFILVSKLLTCKDYTYFLKPRCQVGA